MNIKIGKIYQINKKIGNGSFGEIYEATNLKSNELVN
jgi:serine/threonine protein kinase